MSMWPLITSAWLKGLVAEAAVVLEAGEVDTDELGAAFTATAIWMITRSPVIGLRKLIAAEGAAAPSPSRTTRQVGSTNGISNVRLPVGCSPLGPA